MIGGVYIFRHPSGLYYIGSTGNFNNRRWEHESLFRHGKHHLTKLQNILKDPSELTWEYFPTACRDSAYELELAKIQACSSDSNMLNQQGNGWTPNFTFEHRSAAGKAKKGIKLSDEHKANISAGLKRVGFKTDPSVIAMAHEARRIPITVDGVNYVSFQDAADAFGLCINTVRNRVNSDKERWSGWTRG